MLKLLERRNQIGDGPAPSIQSPYHHNIDFTAARGSEQRFTQLASGSAGTDLFHLRDDGPNTAAVLTGIPERISKSRISASSNSIRTLKRPVNTDA